MTETAPTQPVQHKSRPCRACGADIIMAPSIKADGSEGFVPLDAKPHSGVYMVNAAGKALPMGGCHLNHWMTCADWKQIKDEQKAKKVAAGEQATLQQEAGT